MAINEENELERQASDMIFSALLLDKRHDEKPGTFIKKYGHRFSLIKKLKAKHFNHRIPK